MEREEIFFVGVRMMVLLDSFEEAVPRRCRIEAGAAKLLLVRNIHFRIGAGCGCIHCRDNAIDVTVNRRPSRVAKYHNGYSTVFEVLLILDVFVR